MDVTRPLFAYGANVTALAAEGDTLAIATADGRIRLRGGNHDGIELGSLDGNSLTCVTALTFADPDHLLVCIGSNEHPFERWKHDLMQLGASGSVWRVELPSGKPRKLADRLAFPFGVATLPNGDAIVSESWRHRLFVVTPGKPAQPVLSDLPAYPARISPSADGKGAWLSLFAPRRQLTEFVLREPAYRNRMMAEIAAGLLGRTDARADEHFPRAAAGRYAEKARGHKALGAFALLRSGRAARRRLAADVELSQPRRRQPARRDERGGVRRPSLRREPRR